MQLTLNFEAGLTESYKSCREYIAARVHQQGRPQKSIAADMDYSPSTLSRKLAQSESDSNRLTVDDMELYMDVTNDVQPVYYLVEKYLTTYDRIEELEKELEFLKASAARKSR